MVKLNLAFSLIELVVVLAIVSILATVGIPSYSSYTKRGHVTEMISATGPCQMELSQIFYKTGSFPNSYTCVGNKGISVAYTTLNNNAKFTVTSPSISETVTIKLNVLNGDLEYKCGSSNSSVPDYFPVNCKETNL